MVNMDLDLKETKRKRINLKKINKLFDKTHDKFYSVSNEFVFRDSINLSIQNDHLLAPKREIFYDYNDQQNIVELIYNSVHNCYFALRTDNSLALLNANFQEVYKRTSKSGTIICMIHNPVNDELITSTIEGFKIYTIKKDEKERWKALMPMCNYSFYLKSEFKFTDDWVKKLEIDVLNCHLYCCSPSDLYIFDFNWNLMRHFKNIHDLPITCVVYSPTSKVFITGSMDSQIKIWSPTGDLIETFKSHSKTITKLILSPYDSNIFLSASLDGTIKMWSLDINQIIYEINFDNREIFWIGLTEDDHLYAATQYDLSIWSINNFLDFWAFSQDRVVGLSLDWTYNKIPQIITLGEEKTIRIFSRSKASQITSILPLPTNDLNNKLTSLAYCRNLGVVYIQIDDDIWIFYTKTYPCAKVAVWNTLEIQKSRTDSDDEIQIEADSEALRRKNNYLAIQDLTRMRRAVEIGLNNARQNETPHCRCIGFLESSAIFWNLEGQCTPMSQHFLLLGLENGTILFCDPLIKDKKYFTLNCSKDPVIEIKHDKLNNYLITRIEQSNLYHIQYWSLPHLEFKQELYCSKSMTSYGRLGDSILVGFEDGTVELMKIRPNMSKDSFNKPLSENELEEVLKKSDKFEHKETVKSIDVCDNLNIFLSCSYDGLIKIWSNTKKHLADIVLDDTLSSCCFLNSNGDLLVSWQKHLFKITLSRIIPELKEFYQDDEDFELSLHEDSDVLDEPALKDETDQPLKIDINTYLNPFNVKLNKEGAFVFDQFKLNKNKKVKRRQSMNRIDEFSESYYYTETSAKSVKTSVPQSLLSTPRDNLLNNFERVDLTLNTKFNQSQIHEYLVNIVAECEYKRSERRNSFPKHWNLFPKFGESPTGTPDHTPQVLTPRSDESRQGKSKTLLVSEPKKTSFDSLEDPIKTDSGKLKKVKKQTEEDKEKEMQKKLAELLPNYESVANKLKETKINSKELILSIGSQSRSALPVKTVTSVKQVPEVTRRIIKRKSVVPIKVFRKSESESDESVNEHAAIKPTNRIKINRNFNVKSETTAKPPLPVKPKTVTTKTSSFISSSTVAKSTDNLFNSSVVSTISKQTVQSEDTDMFNSVIEKKSYLSSVVEKTENSTQELINELNDQTENELKELNSTHTTVKTPLYKKQRTIEDENEILIKTKALFEYLYIKPSLPKRVGSASYVLNIDSNQVKEFKKPELRFDDTFIEDLGLNEDFPRDPNLSQSKYFMNWLESYENQRKSLRDRMNRVKSNNDRIMIENLQKWNQSIRKKSAVSRPTSGNVRSSINFTNSRQSSAKFESKSETVMKTRPKSVSFEKKSVIHVQPYLVSQLEMEEIMKEANDRLGDKLSSVSFKDHVDIDTDSDYETLHGFGSTVTRDNSGKRGISSGSSQKVKFTDVQTPRTDHRLSKLSTYSRSLKSGYIEDSDYELLSEKEDKAEPSREVALRRRVKTASSGRSRTPSSIPSKRKYFGLIEYPEINLEFQLPDSPEKYLLPIRFPILYGKIIKSLSKLKFDEYQIKNRKLLMNRTKVI